MPKIETWSCAICGKQKKDANRWWWITEYKTTFVIQQFHTADRNQGDAYCGRQCVQKAVEQFLEKAQ